MNLCIVTNELTSLNGYGKFSIDLVDGLKKLGCNPLVITSLSSQNQYRGNVIPILRHKKLAPLSSLHLLIHDLLMVNFYSRQCDLIHFLTESHLAYSNFINKPYLVTCHGTWALRPLTANVLTSTVFKRAYSKALNVVSVSNYTSEKLNSKIPFAHLKVIKNGIKLQKRAIKRTRRKMDESIILSVGSFNQGKDFLTAARSVGELSSRLDNVKYHIITGRPNTLIEKELKQTALQYSYELVIHKKLSDDERNTLYQKADLFLLTPRENQGDFEGFGLIFLEAAQYGLPVVTTRSGAVAELITSLQNGLLKDEGDFIGLAEAMHEILTNKAKYKKLQQAGFKHLPYYSSDRMAAEYFRLYQELVV
jgi:glycosyltransferase involved in cell wall biosynthesis